ncbi:MAG: hypothetical protein ACU826_06640 [Gammaproteobacteria bacterium]
MHSSRPGAFFKIGDLTRETLKFHHVAMKHKAESDGRLQSMRIKKLFFYTN